MGLPMADIKNPAIIWTKGILFLGIGLLSAGLLLAEAYSWKVLLLLVVAIWAFCRFYYFAFYVIEHYVDPGYRFAGLLSFVRYAIGKRRGGSRSCLRDSEGPEESKTTH